MTSPRPTPSVPENRPGLDALDYRVGTWATFRERLQWGLSRQTVDGDPSRRPLAALGTRENGDFTVALLDAAAVLGDVLSFYQERIANEHYLRTATERRSVLELARAIGYELAPGVSAETALAFTVEDAPGAPAVATVPAGTRVRSIPGPGELPQTFETTVELVAHAELNDLRPRRHRPQRLALHVAGASVRLVNLLDDLDVDPAAAPLRLPVEEVFPLDDDGAPTAQPDAPQDAASDEPATVAAEAVGSIPVLGTGHPLAPGDRLLAVGRRGAAVHTAVVVVVDAGADPAGGQTTIRIDVPPPPPTRITVRVPPVVAVAASSTRAFGAVSAQRAVLGRAVDAAGLQAVLAGNRWDVGELRALTAATRHQPASTGASATAGSPGLYAFRQRVGMFGAAAPAFASLPVPDPAPAPGSRPSWDAPEWPVRSAYPTGAHPDGVSCFLERPVRDVGPGSWAMLESGGRFAVYRVTAAADRAVTGFTLAGRATGLTLADPDGSAPAVDNGFTIRSTTAAVASIRLSAAPLTIDAPVEGATETETESETETTGGASALALAGFHPMLVPGRMLAVHGEQLDAPGVFRDEIAAVAQVVHRGGVTFVTFDAPLRHRYRRHGLRLDANVVTASHGETVAEVLGGGDATRPHQRFRLRRPPLTHLPSSTGTVAVAALELRVDGVRWDAVASFADAGPDDRCYLVRIDDDGATWVQFGDGVRGARLPSGSENVVAVYRSGTGLAGQVAAGSLTLLDIRPLGVRSVRNPLAPSGGQDGEQLADARDHAPRHVLTFDRVVSRRDAEQFVRGYPGIGKADAAVIRRHGQAVIAVAVATAAMAPLEEAPGLRSRLREALAAVSDPATVIELVDFTSRLVDVSAALAIDGSRVFDDVAATAAVVLAERFGPAQRQFGQAMTGAEVIAALASVDGVLGVDLDQLARSPAPPPTSDDPPPARLTARRTALVGDTLVGPELLVLNPLGLHLYPMGDRPDPSGAHPTGRSLR